MNKPISHAEQQTVLEQRRRLFALWANTEQAPEAASGPAMQRPLAPGTAPTTVVVRAEQAPQAQHAAKGPSDEVRALLQKFTNPNTDRWSVL